MQFLRVFLPLAALGCAQGSDRDPQVRESPAFDLVAPTVRLRLDVTLQVPEDVRPNVDVRVNGQAQELVDVPIDREVHEGANPEGEEAEAERVPVMGYAEGRYERMIGWVPDGTAESIDVVDRGTGRVLREWSGSLPPLCARDPLPAPVEVYYRFVVVRESIADDADATWRIGPMDTGCIYSDPERDRHADF